MKTEQDYLKKLLEAGQTSEKPTFDIEDLKAVGFDYNDPQFEFHMRILNDHGFIEQDDGSPGFGLTKSLDGFCQWSVLPLRLTSLGHQFIEALSNEEVWATIKRDYPNASIATLKIVSLKLLEEYAQKKITEQPQVNSKTNASVGHQPEVVPILECYKTVIDGILSRFTKTYESIFINQEDDATLRQLILELRAHPNTKLLLTGIFVVDLQGRAVLNPTRHLPMPVHSELEDIPNPGSSTRA